MSLTFATIFVGAEGKGKERAALMILGVRDYP